MAVAQTIEQADVYWGEVFRAYLTGVAGTVILSGIIFLILGANMWWLTIAGTISLFVAGLQMGKNRSRWEGLAGALSAVFFFATLAVGLLLGMMFDFLPDPLPGLPKGDSTFFFIWPLAALLGAEVGVSVGRRKGPSS